MRFKPCLGGIFLVLWLLSCNALGQSIRVAVASNFLGPLKALAQDYERLSGVSVRISSGSTGKLYAQIYHGAPYDVFLAADQLRPLLAVENGLAVKGSRFTYAIGQLAVCGKASGFRTVKDWIAALLESQAPVAVANPKTAPYGAAAMRLFEENEVLEEIKPYLITGENIAQTYQFWDSRSVDWAVISASQLSQKNAHQCIRIDRTESLLVRQDAVLLVNAASKKEAEDFLDYLKSDFARALLEKLSYISPPPSPK